MFAASKTDSVSASAPDAQFNYVTMLLHGDGTNGAQNNTFLDSSTNNFTITRNGNTTQGSFSPYGSNWSNYFNGSSYLNTSSSNELIASGNGFTIEAWVYYTAITNFSFIAASTTGAGSYEPYWFIGSTNTGNWRLSWGNATAVNTGIAIALNTWHHVAISMTSSGSGVFYLNGVSRATATGITLNGSATGIAVSHGGGGIAGLYPVNGYISNLRYVKNSSVYTSNFTPPTAPLTAITGTSFLSCQSNRFIDNSASPLTITVTGTPSVQRFNPFGTSTAYSTSVIGGSGYFDGSGDYLSTPSSSNFAFGTGDFTVEAWIYTNTLSGERGFIQTSDTAGGLKTSYTTGVIINIDTSPYGISCNIGGTGITSGSTYIATNTWYHVALTRASGSVRLFINGALVGGPTTITANLTGTYAAVGGYYNTSYLWNGYIANLRVVKGTAVYTASFTPPTSPVTAISGTSLLCNFTNGAIFDNAMMNDLETVGDAQISTSVKKYGTGSLAFDGLGDSLVGPSNVNYAFGTGDFTVEGWFYQTADNTYPTAFEVGSHLPSTGIIFITKYAGNATIYSAGFYGSTATTLNAWNHIAWVRSSGVLQIYVNGTGGTSVAFTNNLTDSSWTVVGSTKSAGEAGYLYAGYIDDLRITKGYARYTSNFTPPTAAFPNTGPV